MKILQITTVIALLCVFETKAQESFLESSLESGLVFNFKESLKMGGGAASFDYDNDGDDDLYIVGGQNPDGLFENDGSGNFIDVSASTKISLLTDSIMSTSVVTGDIDNDGIREIFIGTMGDLGTSFEALRPNLLLKYNPQTSHYENIIQSSLISDESFCMGGHFFDSNQDGFLDLYIMNYVAEPKVIQDGSQVVGFDHECFENKLYINSGDGTFSDQTTYYNLNQIGCTLAATTSDLDWDGDPDLIVANDFGKWLEPNQLFRNEGMGLPYSDISTQSNTNAQMYAMGIAVGDYDEDLDLDYYVTNIGENAFFQNEGDMNFINKATELDIQNEYTHKGLFTTGWGAIMEDFNNDSYLDLFVSNGYVYSAVHVDDIAQPDELFLGSSDFNFTNVTKDCGIDFKGPSRGALFGDWNMDGHLDLITVTNELLDEAHSSVNYYKNLNNEGNWVGFNLIGTASNRDAFGAKVILHAEGRALLKELKGGDSHASQSSSILHFGISDIQTIDSIEVFWPSGNHEIHFDIPINEYHTITEGDLTSTNESINKSDFIVYPNPVNNILSIEIDSEALPPFDLQIFNSLGESVYEDRIQNHTFKIDVSQMPPGIYSVAFNIHSQVITKQVIILTPKF